MKQALKKLFKKVILPLWATRVAQPLFQMLHGVSLLGMNIGRGSEVDDSGELQVMRYAARLLATRRSELIIFDVGANKGDWTLAAKRIFPSNTAFHCFEPSELTR